MKKPDWKGIVATVAPTLATALGGPLAGVAVRALSSELLGREDATQAELEKALVSATPEQLAAIKNAENAFASRMRELDIDLERIHQQDRDSARQREIQTSDWTPKVLAGVVVVSTMLGEWWAMTHAIPDGSEVIVGRVLGTLDSALMMVLAYYYGSSRGSDQKTEILSRSVR